ncbi:Putative ribonuclease H protein At1g65750 [Linum perenne]
MQTAFLPVSLCDKIDSKIRSFIWGSSNGVRKLHNVNWNTVCKPKSLGGLGLRSARELNQAFLMKVAWGIVSRPNELWVQTLVSKYLHRTEVGFTLKRMSGFSSLWRGVMKVWDYTLKGLYWSIKSGRNTKFWTDRWLDSGIILIDHVISAQGVDISQSVSDLILSDGNWDIPKLSICLPYDVLVQVIGMTPPCAQLGEDELAWGLEANGRFSVKSAYIILKEIAPENDGSIWRKVWDWEGPAKIKQFMWLVSHRRLMTNEERCRRHIAADALCPECRASSESVEHVLRLCHVANAVWREMLPSVVEGTAADASFIDWWSQGIGDRKSQLVFGVIAWLLWRRRNHLVFSGERMQDSEICCQARFWIHLYSLSWKALQVSREAPGLARQAQLIGWRPAEEGWFSLNSDGSLYRNPSSSAAGGVVRDCNGRFVTAFAANLGVCSIMRAELRGIIEGMKLAWNTGIRKLRIQSDSKAAVEMLSTRRSENNQHASLIEQFNELQSRDWSVSIHHVYREANYAADYLANLGQGFSLGVHLINVPDVFLQNWLKFDLVGCCTSRRILNLNQM